MSLWLLADCLVLVGLAVLGVACPRLGEGLLRALVGMPGDALCAVYGASVPAHAWTDGGVNLRPRFRPRPRSACEARCASWSRLPGHASARAPLRRRITGPRPSAPVARRLSG